MTNGLVILNKPNWAMTGGWMPLLDEWARLQRRFEVPDSRKRKDVAYWYGERALTGLLAAAAWRLKDGSALEEFLGKRQGGAGRGDLWLGTGRAEFTVEAKYKWGALSREAAANSIIRELAKASAQLWELATDYRMGQPVALCCLVPEWPSKMGMDNYFGEVASRVCTSSRLICAYESPIKHAGKHYLGVLLVAEPTSWKPRRS